MKLTAEFDAEHWIDDHAISAGNPETFEIGRVLLNLSPDVFALVIANIRGGRSDLDILAEKDGIALRHNGPFTVRVEKEEVEAFLEHYGLKGALKGEALESALTAARDNYEGDSVVLRR